MYQQNDLKKGILGAVIGSIPGILLWILLGYIGFTASIVGFVIAFGILFGYNLLCSDIDKTGMIICIIVLLIAIYIGEHMTWSIVVYKSLKEYSEEITLGDCIKNLSSILKLIEMKGDFIFSVVKGYLFGLLGAFSAVKKLLR
ncbi:MAG: hypothetical protein K2H93_06340 [Oscillospiraceae bacterium]|nr:hypothetical protein [Oscillospiraceae bacterium]